MSMQILRKDLESLIADWSDYITGRTEPYSGHAVFAQPEPLYCKCEIHPWDESTGGLVPRHADLFMGMFYEKEATEPIILELFIGGLPCSLLTMNPGEKTLAFQQVTFVPLLSLRLQEVRIRPSNMTAMRHLHLIYANVTKESRSTLLLRPLFFVIPEYARLARSRFTPVMRYVGGMGGLDFEKPRDATAFALPEFSDLLLGKQAACEDQLQHFKRELLEAAWHPNRHLLWCLDIEDLQVFQDVLPKCSSLSRLWYDEILIISSDQIPEVGKYLKLLDFHDSNLWFCCLHSNGRSCLKVKGKAGRYLAFDAWKPYWFRQCWQEDCSPA